MSTTTSRLDKQLCEIWHIRIGPNPVPIRLVEVLSPEERRHAARFVREIDRRRFLLCHAALRSILGEWLGEPPEHLRFASGRWGKPVLDRPFSDAAVEFNLSHTAELGLVAVTRGRRVGIDVETIRPLNEMLDIARRVLAARDCAVLTALPPEQAIEAFWRAWTANEACLKAVGSGLGAGEPAIRLDRRGRPTPCNDRLCLHRIEVAHPLVAALAIEGHGHATFVKRDFHLQASA